mmetsp:Transcript_32013/g.96369  ORF Transcript_32013/g.96369 Transcript_32013/m.96369 type:complete len:204 (+) Transcript_32013:179-790(+)
MRQEPQASSPATSRRHSHPDARYAWRHRLLHRLQSPSSRADLSAGAHDGRVSRPRPERERHPRDCYRVGVEEVHCRDRAGQARPDGGLGGPCVGHVGVAAVLCHRPRGRGAVPPPDFPRRHHFSDGPAAAFADAGGESDQRQRRGLHAVVPRSRHSPHRRKARGRQVQLCCRERHPGGASRVAPRLHRGWRPAARTPLHLGHC